MAHVSLPLRHPMTSARHWLTEAFIPVDEFHRDGALVIRAEAPGIDPEKDVELTVAGGLLHISVERRAEEEVEERRYVRQEMRYGCLERILPVPAGVSESDVKATYKDGILEIVVPEGHPAEPARIPITKK